MIKMVSARLKGVGRLTKTMLTNPKGFFGFIIILFFSILSFAGPLVTPYDPIKDEALAGDRAAATWMRYLPPLLGGIPSLTENVVFFKDKSFTDPTSFEELNHTQNQHISLRYEPNQGSNTSGPGCISVTFKREETGKTYGDVKLDIWKEAYFPYTGHPRKFDGLISFLTNGTVTKKTITEKYVNWTTNKVETRTYNASFFDAPVNIKIFLELVDYKRVTIWPVPNFQTQGMTSEGTLDKYIEKWVTSQNTYIIDSSARWVRDMVKSQTGQSDPLLALFPLDRLPATYIWGIEITFLDRDCPDKEVETTLYLDDFGFQFEGTAWGLLGTDQNGRDIFSQLVYGSRLSLYIGLLSAILGVVIGLIIGLISGYMGRFIDEILMRFTDMLLVLPSLPLLIILTAVLGPKLENLIILLGLLGWMSFARLARSQVLTLRERTFVEAAKAAGAGRAHIITTHILPNVLPLVYVSIATSVPGAITAEAALSFLGFYDPLRMSWGRMLSDAQMIGEWDNWWWVVPPGLCIALLSMAFILFGYALDEILNPKLRVRK